MKVEDIKTKERIPLKKYVTFGIGGEARYLAEPRTIEEVKALIDFAEAEGLPYFILGGGSNVLFPDEGYEGLVIRMAALSQIEVDGEYVIAEAGVPLKRFILVARDAALSGPEPLIGIPGEVGGSIVMNAGLREREIGELIESVTILTYDGIIEDLPPSELGLAYRSSKIQDVGIIVRARFKLTPGDQEHIDQEIQRFLERRKATQPYGVKSAGCVFKNPEPDVSAGFLLDKAGLKGFRKGDAMYSDIHANFIVNLGEAREEDVRFLIEEGKRRVYELFGYELEEEIVLVENPGGL